MIWRWIYLVFKVWIRALIAHLERRSANKKKMMVLKKMVGRKHQGDGKEGWEGTKTERNEESERQREAKKTIMTFLKRKEQ